MQLQLCLIGLVFAAGLTGCAAPGSFPSTTPAPLPAASPWSEWQPTGLPGKRPTRYQAVKLADQWVVEASADSSASLFRRNFSVPMSHAREVRFSWRVERSPIGANAAVEGKTDAPARLMLAFAGDVNRLSAKNRALYELAELVSGEAPPYATLTYVWDENHPAGTVLQHPKTDRVRKIVLDNGPAKPGLWHHHVRDFQKDFEVAFGELPGPLVAVMVMTDSDNTRSRAQAFYGPVDLR